MASRQRGWEDRAAAPGEARPGTLAAPRAAGPGAAPGRYPEGGLVF